MGFPGAMGGVMETGLRMITRARRYLEASPTNVIHITLMSGLQIRDCRIYQEDAISEGCFHISTAEGVKPGKMRISPEGSIRYSFVGLIEYATCEDFSDRSISMYACEGADDALHPYQGN